MELALLLGKFTAYTTNRGSIFGLVTLWTIVNFFTIVYSGTYWDNTVTPGEELSVNTDRFLRNFGPIHTDGRRPQVCID